MRIDGAEYIVGDRGERGGTFLAEERDNGLQQFEVEFGCHHDGTQNTDVAAGLVARLVDHFTHSAVADEVLEVLDHFLVRESEELDLLLGHVGRIAGDLDAVDDDPPDTGGVLQADVPRVAEIALDSGDLRLHDALLVFRDGTVSLADLVRVVGEQRHEDADRAGEHGGRVAAGATHGDEGGVVESRHVNSPGDAVKHVPCVARDARVTGKRL